MRASTRGKHHRVLARLTKRAVGLVVAGSGVEKHAGSALETQIGGVGAHHRAVFAFAAVHTCARPRHLRVGSHRAQSADHRRVRCNRRREFARLTSNAGARRIIARCRRIRPFRARDAEGCRVCAGRSRIFAGVAGQAGCDVVVAAVRCECPGPGTYAFSCISMSIRSCGARKHRALCVPAVKAIAGAVGAQSHLKLADVTQPARRAACYCNVGPSSAGDAGRRGVGGDGTRRGAGRA